MISSRHKTDNLSQWSALEIFRNTLSMKCIGLKHYNHELVQFF